MLDIKIIRENPDLVKKAVEEKNDYADIDKIIALDEDRKELIKSVEVFKAERNNASKAIGLAKKSGEDASTQIKAMQEVSTKIKEMDSNLSEIDANIKAEMLKVPNMPADNCPVGKTEKENVVVREWGEPKEKGYALMDHLAIAEKLDILDFKRGAKLSGSGFGIYKGAGALLERALINYFLDTNTLKGGYTEIFPPFMVKPECAEGTGQLPKSKDQMYYSEEDDMYLIPTAEVPVTNIHREEILNLSELPIKYCAYSPCFRREAGSWGKDTRGFLRVHQFNKVEMVKFVKPEDSFEELELLVADSERLLQGLGLKYRVLELCRGDLSFAAAKCYDLEVWSEAEKAWLEVSSCSNFLEFQSRRANIRYRAENNKTKFVHTLNGSGLATARILVAILENYQNASGEILIPEVLKKYMHGMEKIC